MGLTHSPAQIVAKLLVDLGVATGPGGTALWGAFTSTLPDRPDNVIAVKNTTGVDESDLLVTVGGTDQHYGVQIMVRAVDEPTCWLKADAVRQALRGVLQRGVSIDSSRYIVPAVASLSPPIGAGMDRPASNRVMYTLNPTLAITQTV